MVVFKSLGIDKWYYSPELKIFCFGEDTITPVEIYKDPVKKICKEDYKHIEEKKKELMQKKVSFKNFLTHDTETKINNPLTDDPLNDNSMEDLSMWDLDES